jgi:peptide/nickel transport system substrate-binding protein
MKKVLSAISLFMFAALLFNACSGGTSSAAPAAGRTNVNISGNIISTLDPHSTTLAADVSLHNQIYESFFFIDDHAQPSPRLADRYEVSSDGLTYTFYVNKKAKFHNGDPVKASDCVFSIKRAMGIANMATYVAAIKDVVAVDDNTVNVILKTVSAPFLINITQIRIISKRAVTEAGDRFGLERVDCGTGPYVITSYNPNTEIVIEAFEDYYRGKAPIQKINYKPITFTSSQLIAFESGELDFIVVPTANWKEIKGSGKYTTYIAPSTKVCYMALNFYKGGVLENKKLRQAVNYALDRDAINAIAYDGIGKPAYFMCNPEFINCAPNDSFVYGYDPEKAKALMAEAGYPNGVDLGILLCPASSYFPKVAQAVQALLADIGMTVKIETLESASASARARTGAYDLYINQNSIVLDMDAFSRFCHSRNMKAMVVKYNSPELDKLFDDGAAEMDVAKRKEIYKKADNFIKDFAAHTTTFYIQTPYAWNKNLNASVGLLYYYIYDWSWK